jgi:uncharacterized membrane protein
MDELFGLPAHPLLVHAPVVLGPLVALLTVAFAVRPAWRKHAWWLFGATAVLFFATVLATQSGEDLQERMDLAKLVRKHRDLGEATRLLIFLQAGATGALALSQTLATRGKATLAKAATPLLAVTVIFAALSTVWMVRTGHEGARVTWNGLPKKP